MIVTQAAPVRGLVLGVGLACSVCRETAWLAILLPDYSTVVARVEAWAAMHYAPRIVTVDTLLDGETTTWTLRGGRHGR